MTHGTARSELGSTALAQDRFAWSLSQVLRRRRVQLLFSQVMTDAPAEVRLQLAALLLVELTARSTLFRFMEWAAYFVGRALLVPPQLLPRSRGPFQLTDAPFRFTRAIPAAARVVPNNGTIVEIARAWSGASVRQPHSELAFGDALAMAIRRVTATLAINMNGSPSNSPQHPTAARSARLPRVSGKSRWADPASSVA